MVGAVRVIEGVYYGGNITQEQRNNPNSIVREFQGYASWFTGQLDGEVLNNDWTYTNAATAAEVFSDE